MTAPTYDRAFYDYVAETASASARVVLPLLFERYRPQSVLDVGCGPGAWLAQAQALGVASIRGLDLVADDRLKIPATAFERINLESSEWPALRRVDLAMSLEFAEHVSEPSGHRLVDYLCASAPVVLFSAAVPFQGGVGHVNERWQAYWAKLFAKHGYSPSLFLRRAIWDDPSVSFWYRQNIVVYYAAEMRALFADDPAAPLDVIHPTLYERHATRRARKWRWKGFRRLFG